MLLADISDRTRGAVPAYSHRDAVPGITNRGQYTEWQGPRLGLRLALARYPAGATMITDCREVATELRHVMAGRNPARVAAADDLDAVAEIRSLIAEPGSAS